jgi:hypothetical protein
MLENYDISGLTDNRKSPNGDDLGLKTAHSPPSGNLNFGSSKYSKFGPKIMYQEDRLGPNISTTRKSCDIAKYGEKIARKKDALIVYKDCGFLKNPNLGHKSRSKSRTHIECVVPKIATANFDLNMNWDRLKSRIGSLGSFEESHRSMIGQQKNLWEKYDKLLPKRKSLLTDQITNCDQLINPDSGQYSFGDSSCISIRMSNPASNLTNIKNENINNSNRQPFRSLKKKVPERGFAFGRKGTRAVADGRADIS